MAAQVNEFLTRALGNPKIGGRRQAGILIRQFLNDVHARSRHFYAERLRGFQDEDSPVVAERAICTASPDWAGAFAAKRIRFGS